MGRVSLHPIWVVVIPVRMGIQGPDNVINHVQRPVLEMLHVDILMRHVHIIPAIHTVVRNTMVARVMPAAHAQSVDSVVTLIIISRGPVVWHVQLYPLQTVVQNRAPSQMVRGHAQNRAHVIARPVLPAQQRRLRVLGLQIVPHTLMEHVM